MDATYVWKAGGPAGSGISSLGPVFANLMKKSGYYTHGYLEYPSLIRGGYNSYQIVFSRKPVNAPKKKIDLYIALDDVCFEKEEFDKDTIIIGDFDNLKKAGDAKGRKVNIPLKEIVKEIEGKEIMKNTVALGASVKVLGLPKKVLEETVRSSYPEKIAEANVKAALAGYDACEKDFEGLDFTPDINCAECAIMSANDAVSIGAIRAGVTFYSTYPMTPASSILHTLAKHSREYNITVKHTEDELAGILMAIGASHAGARAMTGTSGGGFALMNEGLGLAAIAETPLVVVLSQRPGPATGMPTWTEQCDMQYAIHASQGEFPRAVYSPGTIVEAYKCTIKAFNLAEKYHIPVIILLDKFLSESVFISGNFDPNYGELDRGNMCEGDSENPDEYFERYKEVDKGVGTRCIPGTPGGLFIANSNEHDEKGFVSDASDVRIRQTDRRYSKMPYIAEEMPHPQLLGREDAELTFVAFGSMKEVLLEAMKFSDDFNFIHFPAVWPLNWEKVADLLNCRKRLIAFENNKTAQLASLIAENTGIMIKEKFLKYDGRPFFTEEVLEYVKEVL